MTPLPATGGEADGDRGFENEARLKAILDTAVDAIITIDHRGV